MFNKSMIIILLVMILLFLMALYALLMQVFGIESDDKASLISGILGMIGGIAGAFGAYFIARMQLTKLLDLQDEKEKERVLLEIKLRKTEEILDVLNRTKKEYFILQGTWFSAFRDHVYFAMGHMKDEIDYEKFKNVELLDAVSEKRDIFVNTYLDCYKYRPYHKELIDEFEKVHTELFKPLTVNINEIAHHFAGVSGNDRTYEELIQSITPLLEEVSNQFLSVLDEINQQIIVTEEKVSNLLNAFQNKEF